jgi:hypothetical protein
MSYEPWPGEVWRTVRRQMEMIDGMRSILPQAIRSVEAMKPWREIARLHIDLQRRWSTVIDFARRFHQEWAEALPPNWRHLRPAEVDAVIGVMARTGLGLVWVPRAEVVSEILQAADDEARLAVLLGHEKNVLDDLEKALAEVMAVQLADGQRAVGEALQSYRAGQRWSAQALAAAVLTTLVEGQLGFRMNELRREFKSFDPMEGTGPLADLRLLALIVAMANRVLSRFLRPTDPIPATFNRHASLHAVSSTQYTLENALRALMLATSLLRELQEQSSAAEALPPTSL